MIVAPIYDVSVLFNEPKLLKSVQACQGSCAPVRFSALQRAEIAEIEEAAQSEQRYALCFSALQRAEIAEIDNAAPEQDDTWSFSALQRAEIAEIRTTILPQSVVDGFSALQRAEIAEMRPSASLTLTVVCFSALQRAEIAEILLSTKQKRRRSQVSVLFNEPKLLK